MSDDETRAYLDPYIHRWSLTVDGDAFRTYAACLMPVREPDGSPAMLKVALEEEERHGAVLMRWWGGEGAAPVWKAEGDAILLQRAMGTRSLARMAREGRDEEATVILCDAIAALHAPRSQPAPANLIPLDRWFADLMPVAERDGGWLKEAQRHATNVLAVPCEIVPLHGDLHHDNVLDFGERGWLAIDPKRLIGDRAFDYTILFCDPDMADGRVPVATVPERFEARLAIVVERSGIPRDRLLGWIIAWCGLSAAWTLGDKPDAHDEVRIETEVAALAIAMLGGRRTV